VAKLKYDERAEELISFKEKRIKFFGKEIKAKDEEINLLQERINSLNFILSKLNENYLIKKLNNLGSSEFENKNKFLNIKEDDILFIDNPNIFNNKVIEKLKGKVRIIIYKKKLNKATKRLSFIFINRENLNLIETKHFAIVNKEMLNKEINKANILSKIIEDYKKERVIGLYS
jgi:predicted RNase H-like nuclease (RuvC/YqgF family)